MRVLLVSANRERFPSPVMPLGLLSVAALARRRHDVRLCDLCFEPDDDAALARAIDEYRPEVIGLGLRNLHTNSYDGFEEIIGRYEALCRTLRRLSAAPLVLGGAGFSLRASALVERLGADHGVVGEGERAFADLLDRLAAGERPPRLVRAASPASIASPASTGSAIPIASIAFTASAAPPDSSASFASPASNDLDALPLAARDLLDPRYLTDGDGTVNVQTKRGCAFNCAYCDYPDLEGHLVRARDPEIIAEEVAACARTPGVSSLFFVDSVFNYPRWHALALCRALERRGAPLPWVCYATPAGLDEELVDAMARAGCVGVEIGSDTGTDTMLRRLRKPFGLDAIRRAHDLFAARGVRDCHTFVVGAEAEGVDEARRTLDFVDTLDPDVAVFIVFREDREDRGPGQAAHAQAIRDLLRATAPSHPGWVVPELGIRFGEKVERLIRRRGVRGPSWLHLARLRRGLISIDR